jgi:oxaloacetate decarboxylase alpha subunit
MNIKEIKEMINLMNENNLTELELEKNGLKIRLRKGSEGGIERVVEKIVPKAGAAVMEKGPTHEQAGVQAATKAIEIKSPMVGTFYKAPSPDAPPYVKVGDSIEVGQVVCIIEAMKLMNEIKSDIKGKVVSVLVENADPVEFGQALFLIEPS